MEIPHKCNICGTVLLAMQATEMRSGMNWGDKIVSEIAFYCTKCAKMVGRTNGTIIEWFQDQEWKPPIKQPEKKEEPHEDSDSLIKL